MENRTDALIIDVMYNPGGVAFYTYALISTLISKPLLNFNEKIAITQEDVYFSLENALFLEGIEDDEKAIEIIGEDIFGYQVDKNLAQSILKYTRFIQDQFRQGKFITDPFPMEGQEYIYPNKVTHYTKPILILCNSLSISCGDIFPALLQDNQRAKVLGSQTAGAGGYVLDKKYSNRFGVADLTFTGSLVYRHNGKPLENIGVEPDFYYEFTSLDYMQNFADFIEYVNHVLLNFY